MSQLRVGEKAPDFALPDQAGVITSLSDFIGHRVVVYFYSKDDSPGCSAEACQFDDLFSEFLKLEVAVLGISADDERSHRAFHEKYDLNFKLLSDTNHVVIAAYGAFEEKISWNGRRSIGIVRSTFLIGSNGEVLHTWYHVSPYGHADEVYSVLTR